MTYLRCCESYGDHNPNCLWLELQDYKKALEIIRSVGEELQPNSGHLYLRDVNNMWVTAREALSKWRDKSPIENVKEKPE
jgi:hypothetical protein